MRIGIFHAGMSVGILGILGMPVGLNNKFTIKQLIEGACYIVMYRDVQCNEKLIQQAASACLSASIINSQLNSS
jgi:xanthosine utilization system XapX-like protein